MWALLILTGGPLQCKCFDSHSTNEENENSGFNHLFQNTEMASKIKREFALDFMPDFSLESFMFWTNNTIL